MKKIFITLIGIGCLYPAFSQNNNRRMLYVGLEGGIGFTRPKIQAYSDHGFVRQTTTKLASTGVHLGLEVFKHGFLEVGFSGQTFTTHNLKHRGENGTGFHSYGGDPDAFTTSLRLRYRLKLHNKIAVQPMFGVNLVSLNIPSYTNTGMSLSKSGSMETPQGVVYDSTFSSNYYYNNRFVNLELGTDITYAITPRLQLGFGVYYTFLTPVYCEEWVWYKRTGQPNQNVIVQYGTNELAAKLTLRYHLRDLVTPEKKMTFYQ